MRRLRKSFVNILLRAHPVPYTLASTMLFSLRSHGSAVTALTTTTKGLVLGDRDGVTIIWNLQLRRPLVRWAAHKDMVVTILEWEEYLVTHGKDGEIAVWAFANQDQTPKLVVSIPVNSLNFCNIVLSGTYLFTPATMDLNNFDVYKINKEGKGLNRVITNYSGCKLVEKDPSQGREWGVIMSMRYINETLTLCLCYESGDVIAIDINFDRKEEAPVVEVGNAVPDTTNKPSGLSGLFAKSKPEKVIERTVINKDPKLTLRYHNTQHRPEPITASTWDIQRGRLLTGSATDTMLVHDIYHTCADVVTLQHQGVQAIVSTEGHVILAHWNGQVSIREDTLPYLEVKSFSRPVPGDRVYDPNTGKLTPLIKLSSMAVIDVPSKRRHEAGRMTAVMCGYDDGVITAFAVSS